jgi:hypothetical protein
MRANTDWFKDAGWGVFIHFLSDMPSTRQVFGTSVDAWNRKVDGFDVKGLAAQLEEIEAGYLFITIGQNSGFYLSPNATYDDYVGHEPSRLSKRDLVADLIATLTPRGIHVITYLPSHAPANDPQAVQNLICTPDWDASKWGLYPGRYLRTEDTDERLSQFQRRWEAVIREWSERWGDGVSGWWFDGCYYADKLYFHDDEPNFASFAAAAKAGNPDSLVAFNPGVRMPVEPLTEYDDYTAGELMHFFPVTMQETGWAHKFGRYVDGAQHHLLTFMGQNWGRGEPRFPDEMIIGFTKATLGHEGVITWEAPPTPEGCIPEPFMAQFRALRDATRR